MKFTDGDIGNPVWLIRNGKVQKVWIYDVTLDGRACCKHNYRGCSYDIPEYIKYDNNVFWSYYLARKFCNPAHP